MQNVVAMPACSELSASRFGSTPLGSLNNGEYFPSAFCTRGHGRKDSGRIGFGGRHEGKNMRYLLKDEYTTPDGEIVQVYWSTADLNVGQMTEFLQKVQAESASEWGVIFE